MVKNKKINNFKSIYFYANEHDYGFTEDKHYAIKKAKGGGEWRLAYPEELEEENVIYEGEAVRLKGGIYKCVRSSSFENELDFFEDEFYIEDDFRYELRQEYIDEDDKEDYDLKIINETNSYLADIDLKKLVDEMTYMEKKLYWNNNLNFENNIFCCEIEFDNLLQVELANLLCTDSQLKIEYLEIYYDSERILGSLLDYRNYLINEGRGQDISPAELQKCLYYKNFNKFYKLIIDMWLYPANKTAVKHLIKKVEDKLLTTEDLVLYHKKHPDAHSRIGLLDPGYVKTEIKN